MIENYIVPVHARISLQLIIIIFLYSCKRKVDKINPTTESISESIYASGIVKSKNQYEAFASVNGIINNVFVSEGDTIKKGSPILSIYNETQKLNKENAELASNFADINSNKDILSEAKALIELSKIKMNNDSLLFIRQSALWKQQVGTKVELEQRELAYESSKNIYFSAILKYNDLKRQLNFSASQSKNNLSISRKMENDFTLKSEIDGIVYSINKVKGENINTQSVLALIGDANKFTLEMQVDEYDIFKIKKGLYVIVTLDSYRGKTFDAIVTKINPLMNERSKTFLVEAEFRIPPEILYPNISFEANIVIQTKEKALLIPRNYMLNDSIVVTSKGDHVIVRTGLKDYRKIEILSGISAKDELIKP